MIQKALPIGIDDFKNIVTEDYYFVDKTELIKDVLTYKIEVTLITRPRRFGKTLNMSMLRYFFEKTEAENHLLFQNLKISKDKEIMKHCGKYPVIFLTLKDVKCSTWKETYQKMKGLIIDEFTKHDYLLENNILKVTERKYYERILENEMDFYDVEESLKKLSMYLERYYGEKVVILIDEYDTAIESGFHAGFYEEVVSFFQNFLSAGLKGNTSLKLAVLTGIIRLPKESIFSGLNNISVYSILDKKYSQYFGFTNEEVEELAAYYNSKESLPEIKKWYNGYRFGEVEIYNPWSILKYIMEDGVFQAYWVNTSSNLLIHQLLEKLRKSEVREFKQLLEGKEVETIINPEITYKDIEENNYNRNYIYSFLLTCGYLKVEECRLIEGEWIVKVKIPNEELYSIFEDEILNTLNENILSKDFICFLEALLKQEEKEVTQFLNQILIESISNFDTLESFYHGLMLGLVVSLREHYQIRSNRESGEGRYDMLLLPKEKEKPGIILEFKIKEGKETLEHAAERALKQIEEKKYEVELLQAGISSIIKYGITFDKKKVVVKVK